MNAGHGSPSTGSWPRMGNNNREKTTLWMVGSSCHEVFDAHKWLRLSQFNETGCAGWPFRDKNWHQISDGRRCSGSIPRWESTASLKSSMELILCHSGFRRPVESTGGICDFERMEHLYLRCYRIWCFTKGVPCIRRVHRKVSRNSDRMDRSWTQ